MTDQNNDDLLSEFGGGRDYDYVVDWRELSQSELWHGYIGSVYDDLLILGDHERGEHVLGKAGDDTIHGGGGGDTLEGGVGDDWLYGDGGDDTVRGDEGADLIYGGEGDDLLYGGANDDTVYGGADDDYVRGDAGNDLLYGGSGDDELRGNEGDDLLYGGEGDDWLGGGAGDDTITGGAGDDTMMGWHGADTFVVGADHGNDTINDFTDGEDLIDLSAINGITGFGDLTITQDGDDARIDTGEGTVTLSNFDVANLDAEDFIFHGDDAVEGM